MFGRKKVLLALQLKERMIVYSRGDIRRRLMRREPFGKTA
jgi:hypothetical protein